MTLKKGCIVPDEVTDKLVNNLMPPADDCLNQFELTQFTGMKIESLDDAVKACALAL
ncbi:hypothetical protein O9993_06920 [Vibrio lentus]|nr:hypothetical protein [Vibrio lentus]